MSSSPIPLRDTDVFKPLKIGRFDIKHRIALAPLTRFRNTVEHVPTDKMTTYYDQRSAKEGTLIITEATFISEAAGGYAYAPGIYSKDQVEHWSKIFEAIHRNKSFVFQQLWSLGRQSSPQILAEKGLKFVSASDNLYADEESKRAAEAAHNPLHGLTIPEIQEYVQNYVKAARNSLDAGADGVEIHSANGYLLNQFLDLGANKRTDQYGGSIENRARFILEVVDAVVEAIGADRVGIRLSPFGTFGGVSGADPLIVAQYAYVIGQLEKRAQAGKRLAYIHLVEPTVHDFTLTDDNTSSIFSNDFAYSIWKGVVLKAGNFPAHPEVALKEAAKGNTVIVCGRFFISNPDLPDRLENGWELTAYDRPTFYTHDEHGYIDYPKHE